MRDQTRVDYSPTVERDFDLPGDDNVAVWVGLNVEHFKIDEPAESIHPPAAENEPDILNFGWRDYGLRAGFWRMLDVFDRHDLRVSMILNSEVCQHEPRVVEAAMDRDWEFIGHGITNTKEIHEYEDERAAIERATDDIADFTGERPRGWLGPALAESYDTPDHLAELGYDYLCDWCNDDQPYPFNVGEYDLINVPYSIEINDIPMTLGYGMAAPEIGQAIEDQFDVYYEEGRESGNGRVMAIALHPFITGQPFRAKYLDDALDYITDHDDVWLTTGEEIADHYYENYY